MVTTNLLWLRNRLANGGEIIFKSTPLQLIESERLTTGECLCEHNGTLM
jgi:hypothetical protein